MRNESRVPTLIPIVPTKRNRITFSRISAASSATRGSGITKTPMTNTRIAPMAFAAPIAAPQRRCTDR
jgi:hypothetical protein